jgi:hypothetical protein
MNRMIVNKLHDMFSSSRQNFTKTINYQQSGKVVADFGSPAVTGIHVQINTSIMDPNIQENVPFENIDAMQEALSIFHYQTN